MSFSAFSDYLQLEKKFSPHTITAYLKDLRDFENFAVSEHEYGDIAGANYAVIRTWIVSLVDSSISNRTINRKISSLKTYYRFLLEIGQIEASPLASHRALKVSKKIQIPFSVKEIENVMEELETEDSFEGTRDRLMIELFYSTGIRRAELINIKLNDISNSQ